MPARIVFSIEQKWIWLTNYQAHTLDELASMMGVAKNTLWRRQGELAREFCVKLRRHPHEMGRGFCKPVVIDPVALSVCLLRNESRRKTARRFGCNHQTVQKYVDEMLLKEKQRPGLRHNVERLARRRFVDRVYDHMSIQEIADALDVRRATVRAILRDLSRPVRRPGQRKSQR